MDKNCYICLLIMLFFIGGCQRTGSPDLQQHPQDNSQMANPASVFCENNNGTLEIVNEDAGQKGICILADGTRCDEWSYYRGECPSIQPEPSNKSVETIQPAKSIPESIEKNCIGFVIGGPDEIMLISEIGGAWARPHPGPFAWGFIEPAKSEFDFTMADDYVKSAQQSDVALLGTIWPFADWDQSECRNAACKVSGRDIFYPEEKMGAKTGIPASRCAPCDYDTYASFVTKLVERYDGDNKEDMPGLEIPVKYWEVLNEPEMKSEDMTFFKGTEEEYVEIFSKTQEAIKAACPDCKVLHAGAAGVQEFMLAYWGSFFSAVSSFDIANVHYIGGTDAATLNVKDFKKLLGQKGISVPIWVTEAEFRSESGIKNSVRGALDAGASRIFFTQFKVGQFGLPPEGKYSSEYAGIAEECGAE
jgi:putative hemolysin